MNLVGIGLYSFPEAAKLTGIESSELRRWLHGYSYHQKGEEAKRSAPLWESPLFKDELDALSFGDLLEVRFVEAFRQHGVSLHTIRVAAKHARELFHTDYPFTNRRFQTDGRAVFAEAIRETGDVEMIDLGKKQYVFDKVVRPSLYTGIEFGTDELAKRWFPIINSRAVVLDPQIAFGKPIVTDVGIRTDVLYESFLVEQDKHTVARLYEVPLSAVEQAVRFEQRQAA
jgi:uncharacterized protein (DUF433 family)